MSAEGIFLLILVALVSGLAGTAFGVIWMGAAEVGWKRASKAFFRGCFRIRDRDGEAQR